MIINHSFATLTTFIYQLPVTSVVLIVVCEDVIVDPTILVDVRNPDAVVTISVSLGVDVDLASVYAKQF